MNRMVPRRPGQGADAYAKRLMVVLAVATLVGTLAGLAAMAILGVALFRVWVVGFGTAALFLLVAVLFLYATEKDFLREVLHWRQGARGERQVGLVLESLVTDGFHVLHDVPTGRGNIDHVVVGPTGFFAVETKSTRSRFFLGKGGRLRVGSADGERYVTQALAEAMEIKDCLERVGMKMWVQAVIALTESRLPKGPILRRNVTLLELKDLRQHITNRPKLPLEQQQIQRAVAAILRGNQSIRVWA